MPTIQDVFSTNVRKLRKSAHLSQEKLAELSGLHRTYIGGIEQKRVNVSLKNIGKIATALSVDPALLFLSGASLNRGRSGAKTTSVQGDEPDGRTSTCTMSDAEYALMSWHGDQVTVRPISVEYEDLTIQVLSNLVLNGYHGDELATRYHEIHSEVLRFLQRGIPHRP